MVKYNLTYGELSNEQKSIGNDSVPCGPETNVDFDNFIWDNVEYFSSTRHSITVLLTTDDIPRNSISRYCHSETLYQARHRGESDECHHPSNCTKCRFEYMDIVCPLPTTANFPPPANVLSADVNRHLSCFRRQHTVPYHIQPGTVRIASRHYELSLLVRRHVQKGLYTEACPPKNPKFESCTDLIGLIADVTATGTVQVRGRRHAPTPYRAISVSKHFFPQFLGSSTACNGVVTLWWYRINYMFPYYICIVHCLSGLRRC